MKHSDQIINFFDENFNEKKSADLARKHRFIQRSTSKLKGYEFIKALIIPSEGLSEDSLKGLCQRMHGINSEHCCRHYRGSNFLYDQPQAIAWGYMLPPLSRFIDYAKIKSFFISRDSGGSM